MNLVFGFLDAHEYFFLFYKIFYFYSFFYKQMFS